MIYVIYREKTQILREIATLFSEKRNEYNSNFIVWGGELNCILHVLHVSKFLKSLEDATFVETFVKVGGQSILAQ